MSALLAAIPDNFFGPYSMLTSQAASFGATAGLRMLTVPVLVNDEGVARFAWQVA